MTDGLKMTAVSSCHQHQSLSTHTIHLKYFPCSVMSQVDNLVVFLSHFAQNMQKNATCFLSISCSKHVHRLLPRVPCSYAFISSLFPKEWVKTLFRMHHFEGSFKNSSWWPSPRIHKASYHAFSAHSLSPSYHLTHHFIQGRHCTLSRTSHVT